MPKILVISNIPTPYNDALFAEVARQSGIEFRAVYAAATEQNRSWQLDAQKAYEYEVMPGWSFGGSAHVNPEVERAVRAFRPDVAVLSGSYAMPTAQLAISALRRTNTPWLYWGEALSHDDDASAPVRLGRALLRRVLRRARGVLAIGSRACVSYARAGVPHERITDFRYYADTQHFALSRPVRERARAEVRASVGVADDAVALLYCGQLIGRKGVDTLLRAVARVRHAKNGSTGQVRVMLAGDGPDRSALEALASNAGVRDAVHFLGFRQPADLPDVFAAADAFVLPSHAEGWGVVVTEAMAAGLPVLASDSVNAAVDLVRDGENGWRFPARADARLAELIQDVAADPCRRASMGARSRAAIRCETPAIAAPRFVQILEAAAEDRPLQPL